MVDWREHRPVVHMSPGANSRSRISCTCGLVLGEARTTDGLPPVLLLIHRHRAALT